MVRKIRENEKWVGTLETPGQVAVTNSTKMGETHGNLRRETNDSTSANNFQRVSGTKLRHTLRASGLSTGAQGIFTFLKLMLQRPKTTMPGWLARLAASLLSGRDLVWKAPEDPLNIPPGRHRDARRPVVLTLPAPASPIPAAGSALSNRRFPPGKRHLALPAAKPHNPGPLETPVKVRRHHANRSFHSAIDRSVRPSVQSP